MKVFDMLESGAAPINLIQERAHNFRRRMQEAGFVVAGAESHPICPVILGDAQLASTFADRLLMEHNIYVIGFSYPVVPMGKARNHVANSVHFLPQCDLTRASTLEQASMRCLSSIHLSRSISVSFSPTALLRRPYPYGRRAFVLS